MAKSFKQLAAKLEAPKRTSEKDILDFLEQDHPATNRVASSISNTSSSSNTNNTNIASNTNNTEAVDKQSNSSNTSNTKSLATVVDSSVTDVTNEDIDVRQTFILGLQYLDRLKDYVHTKRTGGQYEYTQKQALHDALDRLFEGATIEARPAHIRQQEESRKQKIRRGIPK
ncbi:hypothetical protein [Hymenobacter lucidus]|uniref:Uncharacterized protein n=1 Tax=Hymenobacter lucidus TaxID=2880930 RepID=A0ABS8AZA1_9BACT|nr:hypothetical protein [Hymenobacter lucidus]MCB2411137.1 hypothetical protein [Hymenobacter lucidus]